MDKILNIFQSTVYIKNLEALKTYISFCHNNSIDKVKGKTVHHHILPKSLFGEYKNIKTKDKWNGVYLSYYSHYYAHYLLTEALDDLGMLRAFTGMHYQNHKVGYITKDELISEDIFKEKISEFSDKYIKWYNTEIEIEGIRTTNGKHISEKQSKTREVEYYDKEQEIYTTINKENGRLGRLTKTLEYYDEELGIYTTIAKQAGKKQQKTKDENWKKTIGYKSIEKQRITKNTEYYDKDLGIYTTIKKEESKNRKITMETEYYDEKQGIYTSKLKENNKKISNSKINKGKFYNIMFKDRIIYRGISRKSISEFYPNLLVTSRNKYLGYSSYSQTMLKKNNLIFLEGLYIEPSSEKFNEAISIANLNYRMEEKLNEIY